MYPQFVEGLEPRTLMDALPPEAGAAGVRFAVIGDYGHAGPPARDVAALVRGWDPHLVLTVGDNNYDDGAAETIDANIGQYYHAFIGGYRGDHGGGSPANRFFPTLGNHDWGTAGARPYLDYFSLPGNERYYDFIAGPVHFFAVDSDEHEPDGVTPDSAQGRWLRDTMSASASPWQVVYFHHPPHSSGEHGASHHMRWPFAEWGADVVFAGHDHNYERIENPADGLTYFVNGAGGRSLRGFGEPVAGSQIRFDEDYGAMSVEATAAAMTFRFVTRAGEVIDTHSLTAAPDGGPPAPPPPPSPDLAAGVRPSRPAEVVAGIDRGRIRVRVTNEGGALFDGPVTVAVLASPDAAADPDDARLATVETPPLRLRPGVGKHVGLSFAYPADLPGGEYRLLAHVAAAASAGAEADEGNNVAAAATVMVAPPSVDLSATPRTPARPLTAGRPVSLTVELRNAGNVPAVGLVDVSLFASGNERLGPRDVMIGTFERALRLAPGRTTAVRLKLTPAAVLPPAGTYVLLAQVDGANRFAEPDEEDNIAAAAGPLVVA